MLDFVADASTILSWLLDDERSENGDRLLTERWTHGGQVHAPSLVQYEVTNGTLMAARKSRISAEEVRQKLIDFESLSVTVDHESSRRAPRNTAALAQTHGLTAYDAAYLELAIRLALPIATNDKKIQQAASAEGVELL